MNVKIHSIRLKNCQSWKDATINLSPGLNVITARNQTGKSVIFKMLKISCSPNYYNRDERKHLIRHGTDYAEATYLFSDFSAGIVRVFPNRVIYMFCNDIREKKFTQQEGIPHNELLERLSVIVEQDSGFIANILDLDQGLLLVNTKSKSNDNLVKLLTEHEKLSNLKTLFSDKYPTYKNKLAEIGRTKDRLEHNLEEVNYVDVEKLEQKINVSECLIDIYRSLLPMYETMNEIRNCNVSVKDYETLIPLVELGILLEDMDNLEIPKKPKNVNKELIDLCNLTIEVDSISQELGNLPVVTNTMNRELLELFNIFVDSYELVESIPTLTKSNTTKCFDLIDTIEHSIEVYNDIVGLGNINNRLKNSDNKMLELRAKLNIEGKSFECPIHGTIKFVDNECIPI